MLLALIAGSFAWLGLRADLRPSRAAPDAADAPLVRVAMDEGAPDVTELRQRVRSLEQQVRANSESTASAIAAMPTATSVSSPPPTPELDGPAVATQLEELIAEQPIDRGWAGGEERTLSEFFRSLAPGDGAHLEDLECRNSMCRVQIHFDDEHARQRFTDDRIGQPPFDHGGFYHSDAETGAFALYTAREGHTLPDVH